MGVLFDIVLNVDPPRATHHEKDLGMRPGKGGRMVPTMRDRPALEAAKELLAMGLHRCWTRAGKRPRRPIQDRIILDVTFCFRADVVEWWGKSPDRDNLCKTFQDVLQRDGWIDNDNLVVGGIVEKGCGPQPFIRAVAEPADDDAWRELYEAVRKPKETP